MRLFQLGIHMFSASYYFIKEELSPRKMLFSYRLGLTSKKKKKNRTHFLFFNKTGKIIKKLNKICSNYNFRKIIIVVLSFSHVWLFATHCLQHARLPCTLPSPGVCSNLFPLSRWCHPTVLSCVILLSFCLLSFPASESFPVSQLFASALHISAASASSPVLPVNIQDWFVLGLTGLTLQSNGLSRVFSNTTVQKH